MTYANKNQAQYRITFRMSKEVHDYLLVMQVIDNVSMNTLIENAIKEQMDRNTIKKKR